MKRMTLLIFPIVAALFFAGCASSKGSPEADNKKSDAGTGRIEAFEGPGGVVAVGDPAENFEKAFPKPENGKEPTSPSIEGVEFIGWQNEAAIASAAVKGGKIVALYHASSKAEPDWFADAKAAFGKAAVDVENDLGRIASWKKGDNELVIILNKNAGGGMTIRIAGTSEILKKLNVEPEKIASSLEAQARSIQQSR